MIQRNGKPVAGVHISAMPSAYARPAAPAECAPAHHDCSGAEYWIPFDPYWSLLETLVVPLHHAKYELSSIFERWPTMPNVAELLEKTAEFDRLATETGRPAQKKHYVNMAKCYRFLAEQQAMIDEPPGCGQQATETMPANACQFFYDCGCCGTRLKPKAGDCCVFCSYGTVACPPIQQGACCG